MTNLERLSEIEERWKAFKHWNNLNPVNPYSETAGPDIEYLITRVKVLTEAIEHICKYNECSMECETNFKEWARIALEEK